MGRSRLAVAPGVALALLIGLAGVARADGAFPDSLSILLPEGRPRFIALATNFGLVSSPDDGATWTWVCEDQRSNCSTLYSLSAAPGDRLYALSANNLIYSDDGACAWMTATGAVGAGGVVDAFPFPEDAQRMLAVVSPSGLGAQTAYTVVASHDGGATFSDVVYTAAAGDLVTGVEVARSDVATMYVTLAVGANLLPQLAVTSDGGVTWHNVDLSLALGAAGVRLIAIDRANPRRVFLRVATIASEALAVFDATSGDVAMPVVFDGGLMTAFVQSAEGPAVAAGRTRSGAVVYRSADGGRNWQSVPGAPFLRALAERAGRLYAAGDNTADGFALGLSTDLGLSFQPLMHFSDVRAIASCVRASCQQTCLAQASAGLWPATMCGADAPDAPASPGNPANVGKPGAPSGCRLAGRDGASSDVALLFAAALLAAQRRRRRRYSGAGAQWNWALKFPATWNTVRGALSVDQRAHWHRRLDQTRERQHEEDSDGTLCLCRARLRAWGGPRRDQDTQARSYAARR